ncbi:unnamed protein product [Ambrosiozyma monospora]|uniref:Unnamed protein product n=1 Tax=Ambrosiozyma monospora TaxID=43982 RepID=A0A9W7DGX1_AMBMO|nr:unnamed protein product [Ambrosiozyma monospora]
MNYGTSEHGEAGEQGIAKTFNNLANNISNTEFVRQGKSIIGNLNRENEKWINEINSKLKFGPDDGKSQPPLLMKLFAASGNGNSQAPDTLKVATDKWKSTFNGFITKQQQTFKTQFSGQKSNDNDDTELSFNNELAFNYSDCKYYDDSMTQSPKRPMSVRHDILIEEDYESDYEDYGGETRAYEHN